METLNESTQHSLTESFSIIFDELTNHRQFVNEKLKKDK